MVNAKVSFWGLLRRGLLVHKQSSVPTAKLNWPKLAAPKNVIVDTASCIQSGSVFGTAAMIEIGKKNQR